MRIFLSISLALALTTSALAEKNDPKSVVEAMFSAFNRHDAAAMSRLYAADATLMSSDFCSPRSGREDVRRTYQELFDTFPDINDDVDTYVTQGDRVAVHFVSRNHTPGKELNLPIATFLTVRNGLILRDDSLFDAGGRPCSK